MLSVFFPLAVVLLVASQQSPPPGWNWQRLIAHGELFQTSVVIGLVAVGQLLDARALKPNWSRAAIGIPTAVFTAVAALLVGLILATHSSLDSIALTVSVAAYVLFIGLGGLTAVKCR
jgi:hypothetical protein